MKNKHILILASSPLLLAAQIAAAHTGVLPTAGLVDGFVHPFLGLDHFLLMFGLGLWLAGQALRPAAVVMMAFLAAMAGGAYLALIGIQFAHVEPVILMSVVAIGLLLVAGRHELPKTPWLVLVTLFALMHGQSHGGEIPDASSAQAYISGFLLATALLLITGRWAGLALQRIRADMLLRLTGGVTGLAGIYLFYLG